MSLLITVKTRLYVAACLGVIAYLPCHSNAAQEILDREAVETLFQKELISYQSMISENKINELQNAVRKFTNKDALILFEFSLSTPSGEPLPAQRAYFNRDPFIDLLKNVTNLDKNSFKISYKLEKFQPQYGGGSAIIHDSGTAHGQMTEAYSGDVYEFDLTQKCRNTITADAETVFKVDSIYCRMQINYIPVKKGEKDTKLQEEALLENANIQDIISEIEDKKHSETKQEN